MIDTSTLPPQIEDQVARLNGVAHLTHLGLIRIEGEDAAKFIHGQLTQDFSLLGMNEARLAAFCSAKGRMQASFIGFKRSPTDILLVISRDLLAATLKRLSMFVMRAKAKLTDASDDFALYGLAGSAVLPGEGTPTRPWNAVQVGAATSIDLYPALGMPRQLRVVPVAEDPPAGNAMPLSVWQWGEVRSGVATLSQPVFEAFVPQMLNYESIGGVNFKKGCYPGQEVVARSQFRGTLKRRAFIAQCNEALASGQEIFNSQDASQPVGLVVQAAASPQGGWDCIVSLQLSALESGTLHSGTPTCAALTLLHLPYPLLDDI